MRVRLLSLNVGFAIALAWSASAWATCYQWVYQSTDYSSGSAVCSAYVAYLQTQTPSYTFISNSATPSGQPTTSGQSLICNITNYPNTNPSDTTTANENPSASTVTGPCLGTCGTAAGTYDLAVPGGTALAEGTSVCSEDNCNYTMGPASSARNQLFTMGTGKQALTQSAVTTGAAGGSCSFSGNTTPQRESQLDTGAPVTDCQAVGSNVSCAMQKANGTYCGTYNGDQVCVGSIANGTCQAFASGGVACAVGPGAAAQSPPAPNNGTAGTPATPTGTVTQAESGQTTTENYYNSSVVAGSTTGAQAGGGVGTNVGTTGTGGTGSTGSGILGGTGTAGSGTGTGNPGDCDSTSGVSGSNASGCTGTVPAAQTPECTSYEVCFQTFWNDLQNAPIVTAVTALNSAWPSGSCPTETVTLSTFSSAPGAGSFDYGTTMCNLWENSAVPILSACTLVFWALAAVFIVLSA